MRCRRQTTGKSRLRPPRDTHDHTGGRQVFRASTGHFGINAAPAAAMVWRAGRVATTGFARTAPSAVLRGGTGFAASRLNVTIASRIPGVNGAQHDSDLFAGRNPDRVRVAALPVGGRPGVRQSERIVPPSPPGDGAA